MEHVSGLADWLDEQKAGSAADHDLPEKMARYATQHGFLLPDQRGPLGEAIMALIAKLRSRTLVEDRIEEQRFRWFDFHVPPGGAGSLTWKHERQTAAGFSLSLYGTGLGGKITLTAIHTRDVADCPVCQAIYQWVKIRVRRYSVPSAAGASIIETTIDPLEFLHQVPEDVPACCDLAIEDVDPFQNLLLERDSVDARSSSARQRASRSIAMSFQRGVTFGLGDGAGLALETSSGLECSLSWDFQPGARYVPYVSDGQDRSHLPPRWCLSR